MRYKRFSAALIAAFLISATTAGASPADPPTASDPRLQEGDLLIANHGFEDGTTGWAATNGHGEPPPEACLDVLTTTTAWSSEGSTALHLPGEPPCADAGAVSAPVDVTGGDDYSAVAHVDAGESARIGFRWLDENDEPIDTTFATGDSSVIEVSASAPDAAAAVAVEVDGHGPTSIDEVLLTAEYTALGPQVTEGASYLSMAAGVDGDGRHVTYAVGTGSETHPAILTITDILTGEVVRNVELPGATGAWGVRQNPVTETVYIGAYGEPALWLYTPGAAEARNVGPPPIESWGFMYDIAFDDEGVAYGGGWGEPTNGFAGAALYTFDEGEGYQGTLGPNPLVTDANYSRPVAYEETTETIFTGTGTNAHLIACSATGEPRCQDLTGLFSPELQDATWVYGITAGQGYVMAWAGDSESTGNDSLVVMKVARDESGTLQADVVEEIEGVVYNGSSPVVGDKIYYTKANEDGSPLHAFDVTTGDETTVPDSDTGIFARRWEAVDLDDPKWPGTTIVGWDSSATLVKYNIETQQLVRTEVEGIPTVSLRINSLARGPDGRIWSAGYLTGGLGAETPMRDDQQQSYAVGGQAEAMITYRGRVYQGRYPTGSIESFAPEDVRSGDAPRLECEIGAQQNRPYGLHGHGDRVYYGSQAGYGHDRGAFGWLDLESGTCTTLDDAIGHQSINTVTASGSKVFGGGSIFYSYDGMPIEDQAKLLVLDESTDQHTTIEWPVPDTRAVNASATADDGTVWFYAAGWLLAMDPETEEWIHQEHVFPDWKPGERISGSYGRMTVNTDGRIYGNVGGKVFGFDPAATLADGSATDNLRVLFNDADSHIAHDSYGNLYVGYHTTRLLRIAPG